MAFLLLENVEKSYSDGTRALRGVSFTIEKGEFVAITGPSGSGKSTLLHVLGFLDRQTKGRYLFDGKTIDDYTENELAHVRNKRMGFVFQAFNLLARTTVLENVMLPLLYSDVKKSERVEIAKKAIASVDLSPRSEHLSSQLSGGEKQRVAIARALVNNPDIIFADEPTGNLDSASGKTVMKIIQKLNEEGHTVILITHEIYTAEHAQRIIRMLDGKIESDSKLV
ncbi:ABC transporter ATP-binding protein [Patescibacteria group bacterium]|nr:ABC transporter ATP-binding protein [Patescibacteria group bacterium]